MTGYPGLIAATVAALTFVVQIKRHQTKGEVR